MDLRRQKTQKTCATEKLILNLQVSEVKGAGEEGKQSSEWTTDFEEIFTHYTSEKRLIFGIQKDIYKLSSYEKKIILKMVKQYRHFSVQQISIWNKLTSLFIRELPIKTRMSQLLTPARQTLIKYGA